MPTKNDISANDPAFPVMPPVDRTGDTPAGYPFPHPGMTLRQWYAGLALQGICAHRDTWGLSSSVKIAETAFRIADAMIAEANRPPSPTK